ncbi:MAG: DMT family transporter [Geminicoccaceae bacterium]|nr:DMT family transporter [Geminicoccaceae bacterium]
MNQTTAGSRLSPALAGALCMVTAGAVFALVNISVQWLAMKHGMNAGSIAFWQYLLALVAALPWIVRQGLSSLRTHHAGWHVLRVLLAAAGVQFWVLGLAHVPVWQAIALVMTSPFFVTAGAGLLLGETVGRTRWLAVLTGFAGGMIILAPWSERFDVAAIWPLLAAAFWAGSTLVMKRLTGEEEADRVTLYLLLLLTPINALVASFQGFALPPDGAWPLVLMTGMLTVLAQYMLARAYERADASYLQPFDHLKLPMNVLLGFIVFGWMPDGSMWPGAAIVVAASVWIMHEERA